MEYTNNIITSDEKKFYDAFYNSIQEKYDLKQPNDIILLDQICYDFLRIKRLQKKIEKEGDVIDVITKFGVIQKPNEASKLMSNIQIQLRQNMKELMLTKKEQIKTISGLTGKSFDQFLTEHVKDVTNLNKDKKDGKQTTS